MSQLRQRMVEEMQMRRFALRTQESYLQAVAKLVQYTGKAPDGVTPEEMRAIVASVIDASGQVDLINITGGEPTLHFAFLRSILRELKGLGIHTAIQTCGLFDYFGEAPAMLKVR